MAVLVEAITVVARREAIEQHFRGGMDVFLGTLPTSAVCADEDLFAVGIMDAHDVQAYIESLEASGLTFCRADENVAIDLAVVDQNSGPTTSAPWLEYGKIEQDGMRLSVCYLAGRLPTQVAVPDAWTYERSLSATGQHVISTAAIGDRLKFLRRENGVEAYLDLQTNQEVYVGRPTISGDTPSALLTQVDAMLHEALKIGEKGPVPRPRFWRRADARHRRLDKELLPEIERIANGPGRELMPAHFACGVILHLLGRPKGAEQALRRANALAPDNVAVLRDLVRCIAEDGRPQEALPFAREAAELDPADETVPGNLAACLMQCGQDVEATRVVTQALEINPDDPINRRIAKMLRRRGW